MNASEIKDLSKHLTPDELAELDHLLSLDIAQTAWRPLPGPQTQAYESLADVIGYGGAAGGGKTDLACGKALTQHRRAAIFRREGTQLTGVVDRLQELIGNKDGYNGQDKIWRLPERGVQIEFGSAPNLGDETKYQGRPKDLLVIDEAANFLEQQVRFLMGWVRTTVPGQRCQTLMTFNPPTNAEGRWIVDFFAPWLDKKHPLYPTPPGQIRYVAVLDGKDVWVESPDVIKHNGEEITPQSRTFIPSRISDNPFLMGTGYMTTLQALPEPLRSQMLYGDFHAGMGDDPWQVIPTAWIDEAMDRWKPRKPKGEMISLGVDVARGGKDHTSIARRHSGMWFDEIMDFPGKDTPNGPAVAGLVIGATRDRAPIHLDVIGVGASPYDFLKEARQDVYGVNVAEKATSLDKSGRLSFFNLRSQLWWQMREALDPANDTGIQLPPDKQLAAELAAPKWSMSGTTIKVESRDDIVSRIGRSPDRATAYVLALMNTPKIRDLERGADNSAVTSYDPYKSI